MNSASPCNPMVTECCAQMISQMDSRLNISDDMGLFHQTALPQVEISPRSLFHVLQCSSCDDTTYFNKSDHQVSSALPSLIHREVVKSAEASCIAESSSFIPLVSPSSGSRLIYADRR